MGRVEWVQRVSLLGDDRESAGGGGGGDTHVGGSVAEEREEAAQYPTVDAQMSVQQRRAK